MARRLTSTVLAFVFTLVLFGTAAGPALAGGVHYRAEPASPPAAARTVVRDIVWKCGGGACVAPAGTSRPEIVCATFARKFGELRSFAAGGRPLDAAELEKCNARAR